MSNRPFAHLHCHSHYSLLDGASSIPKMVQRTVDHGMTALALTDHGNLHGALEFYRKCKSKDINPIIGYEAYIAPGSRTTRGTSGRDSSYHLTLLCQNATGFKNLVKLASMASLEGFFYKPRIDKEILEAHSEGLICLSGCVSSEFSRMLLTGGNGAEEQLAKAADVAKWFHRVFDDRYFIEIMNNGVEIQREQLRAAVEVANRIGLPLVATSDCHYVDRDDAEVQDVMLCINTGRFRTDTQRMKMEGNQFYLRPPEEMYASFPGLEHAVARSQEIADTVDIQLELGKRFFPVFDLPKDVLPDDRLSEICYQGLKERYADKPEMWTDGELCKIVVDRLERELSVIKKLGFANYFLICWDFVVQARERDIPATARGSGVGAIVCYALYLSHVCPIEYGLLFERFLDENRLEAPDIDIDFCKDRRADIIRYVKDKYGEDSVAQIGTFGTMKARAAIKDVGRALGIPLARVNQITAMVPDQLGISLDKAIAASEELKAVYEGDPEISELLDFARKLEGLARNIGTHAAAVVISDGPLTNYAPLGRVPGKDDVITQWSMKDVEDAGLLKMDFLGLRTLTILRHSVDLIEQTTGKRIDIYKFPLDDLPTYKLLQSGDTKGVFQLESGGIRDLLQKMKPDHFRDIIATNALYRPGPLEGGMVQQYVDVKRGRKPAEYKLDVLKEILEETHGVMVYQEQVMQILNRLGKIQLAAAYTCIKAISKKKEDLIAQNYEQFMAGAQEQGLPKKDTQEMWDMILKFAGYGFNKCVVADTVITHAETGEQTTVGELFQNRRAFRIHALHKDNTLKSRTVTDIVWNGRKCVYKLTTRLGHQLTATANHPLKTFEGWTNLGDLKLGDRIASPRGLATAASMSWPAHELIVLGYLISEGNTCHPSCLYFYNNDQQLIDEFVESVQQFPETHARIDHRHGSNRMEVCVSTGRDAKFTAGNVPWNASNSTAVQEQTLNSTATRSGAFAWAANLGLIGKKASEKFIPNECFTLDDDCLALLLGRMWAGDGFVGAKGQVPYYATSSERLARDIQNLLLRLSIVSRIHHKVFRYQYQGEPQVRTGWTVHLIGDDSIANFVQLIAPNILGRESQLKKFRNDLRKRPKHRSSADTIPAEVRTWVNQERIRAGLKWRELEEKSGVCTRELASKGNKTKRGFRRSTILRLAEFFSSERLMQISQSNVFWDTVTSIEPMGIEDTYDLSVEHDHNFVADGLIVHNSHSTAYALVAYQTAYLKTHYPVEFMAALLTGDIPGRNFTSKDSLVEHIEDCRRMKIEVVPPCINHSDINFTVGDGKIYFAMSAIKGCGGSAAAAIAEDRKKNGPFKNIFDLCERVDSTKVSRSAIETLIKAGALDCFGAHRAQLYAALDRAIQAGTAKLKDKMSGQKSLFGGDDDEDLDNQTAATIDLPDVPEMNEREKLVAEKEVLGYYLTSHPLAEYEDRLKRYCSHKTSNLAGLKDRDRVSLGGMISSVKQTHVKNPRDANAPTKYAMFDLEDVDGAIRCILWPQEFATMGSAVIADAVVVLQGRLDFRGGDEANLIVDKVIPLDSLGETMSQGVKLLIDEDRHGMEGLKSVYEILRGYPGNRELKIEIQLADGTRVEMSSSKKIEVNEQMHRRLTDLLGKNAVEMLVDQKALSAKAPAGNKWGRG